MKFTTAALSVVSAFLFVSTGWPVCGQDVPTASGRVFGTIWHSRVQLQDGFRYLNGVREELGLKQPGLMMFGGSGIRGLSAAGGMRRIGVSAGFGGSGPRLLNSAGPAEAQPEVRGTLLFLQLQPEVSMNTTIAFESCPSLEEFEARVRQQARQMGPAAELIGAEERYEINLDFSRLKSSLTPVPQFPDGDKDPDGGKPQQVVRMSIVMSAGSGGEISAKGGNEFKLPPSISTYFRYQDGMLFSSQTAALQTLELPAAETLQPDEEVVSEDIAAELDFTRIPREFKQSFWTELERQASVFLQQWDNEAPGEYSLRRVIAQGRLEVLRRVMFDLDRVRFQLSFSDGGEVPIASQLRLTARENSVLAAFLQAISNRGTQLTVLQEEESPLVVASTLAIPDSLRPFLGAFVASLNTRVGEYATDLPAAQVLVAELADSLQRTVETGFVDAAVSLRGTVADGLIPCGGVRLESAEKFVDSLELLLQVLDSERQLIVSRSGEEDDVVSIRVSPLQIPFAKEKLPLQLNLVGRGNWLWMTVGDREAVDLLESLVYESEESLDITGRGTPLLVRMKLNHWLGETDDPLSSLPAALIRAAEELIQERSQPRMMISLNGEDVSMKAESDKTELNSLAEKSLQPHQSDLELTVRSANRELLVELTAGAGLPRLAAGQYLQAQSRVFRKFNFNGGSLKLNGVGKEGGVQIQLGAPPDKAE